MWLNLEFKYRKLKRKNKSLKSTADKLTEENVNLTYRNTALKNDFNKLERKYIDLCESHNRLLNRYHNSKYKFENKVLSQAIVAKDQCIEELKHQLEEKQ